MKHFIDKKLQEAINLLLLWMSCEITAMEGNDEQWLFLMELRDDLRKLNEMFKKGEK